MYGLRWLLLTAVMGSLVGCGTLWREQQARTFSQLSYDLREWIDLDDPHRQEVLALIDDGWMAAWEGRLGWFGGMGFEVAFEECASDGSFDDGEMKELRRLAAGFVRERSDERRARLLAIKSSMDAEITVERRSAARFRRGRSDGGGEISDWLLPDDVSDAVGSAGWELDGSCRSDQIDGIQFVFCEARRGPLYANVKMDRYPREEDARAVAEQTASTSPTHQAGDTLLTVTVLDGPASEVLRNAIVAKGDRLTKLSSAPVRASITGASWTLDGCDAHRDGYYVTVSCEAKQHGRKALVDLEIDRRDKTPPEQEERVVTGGEAGVHQGRSYLKAAVYDVVPAQELLTGMLE